MADQRHLPTSVFAMLAVLIIALGSAWWVNAEPAPAPAPRRCRARPATSTAPSLNSTGLGRRSRCRF